MLALASLTTLGTPIAAVAQEAGKEWTQFQGDAAHDGFRAGAPGPPYAPAWTIRPDASAGQRLSAPVLAGTSVFVTGPDALFAFDTATGSELWRDEREGAPIAPAVAAVGAKQAVVYTTGRETETSQVVAVDAATGRELWDAPVQLKDESRTGVSVDEDRAFVGDESGNLYAIDLTDGAIAWSASTGGRSAGPPAVGDGVVVVLVPATDASRSARVVAFDAADGDERWSVAPDVTATNGSLPAIDDESAVVAFSTGTALGLSLEDGSESWSARIPAAVSLFVSPALADGSVFLADSTGGIHRLTSRGQPSWLFEANETLVRASPAVAGRDVIVGFEDGSVAAVAIDTGHLVFRSAPGPAPVDGIALSEDTVVVTRSGAGRPQIVGLANDPNGELLDEASPTVPVAVDLALGFALALAVGAVVLLLARTLGARRRIEDPSVVDRDDADGNAVDEVRP